MNILFCGDHNAEDGILIATLSLIKNSGAKELHIYILTMYTQSYHKKFKPFSKHAADYLKVRCMFAERLKFLVIALSVHC